MSSTVNSIAGRQYPALPGQSAKGGKARFGFYGGMMPMQGGLVGGMPPAMPSMGMMPGMGMGMGMGVQPQSFQTGMGWGGNALANPGGWSFDPMIGPFQIVSMPGADTFSYGMDQFGNPMGGMGWQNSPNMWQQGGMGQNSWQQGMDPNAGYDPYGPNGSAPLGGDQQYADLMQQLQGGNQGQPPEPPKKSSFMKKAFWTIAGALGLAALWKWGPFGKNGASGGSQTGAPQMEPSDEYKTEDDLPVYPFTKPDNTTGYYKIVDGKQVEVDPKDLVRINFEGEGQQEPPKTEQN